MVKAHQFVEHQNANGKKYQPKKHTGTIVLSYGPCQFPTLGFIVERFKEIKSFVSKDFWYIKMIASKREANGQELSCEPKWARDHLFVEAEVK